MGNKVRLIDANDYRERRCRTCINRVQCDNGGNLCFDIMVLNTCPTIEAQPVKHGRWLPSDSYITTAYGEIHRMICSECGAKIMEDDYYDYESCPVCGARMDGDKDNNVRNLTDEETAIYESRIEDEAKDTGLNIMGGDGE